VEFLLRILSYVDDDSFVKDVIGVNLPARIFMVADSKVSLIDIQSVRVFVVAVDLWAGILIVHSPVGAIVHVSSTVEVIDESLDFLNDVPFHVIDGD